MIIVEGALSRTPHDQVKAAAAESALGLGGFEVERPDCAGAEEQATMFARVIRLALYMDVVVVGLHALARRASGSAKIEMVGDGLRGT